MRVEDEQIVRIPGTQSLLEEWQGGSAEIVSCRDQIRERIDGESRVAAELVFHGMGGVVLTTPFPEPNRVG